MKKEENTQKEENNVKKLNGKNDNKSIVFAIIIILIIVGAVIILYFFIKNNNDPAYLDGANKAIYNYYVFNKQEDNKWYSELTIKDKPFIIPFYYNPFQARDIPIDNNTIKTIALFLRDYKGGRIYITVDPYESSGIVIAGVEIARLLGTKYDIFNFDVRSATIYAPYDNYTGFPVITCANAKPNVIVIMLNVTGKNEILTKNNCIHLNAINVNESIRVADSFSFRILNIITDTTR